MIDIHTHLLPNIDDGVNSFEEALEILNKAKKNGVTDIIITPHYNYGRKYNANNAEKTKKYKKLVESSKEIKINLHLGNEVLYDTNLLNISGEYLSLANSKYLLLELPRNQLPNNLLNDIHEFQLLGIEIIIAHPERYYYFQDNINLLIPFIKRGVMFQGNLSSLFNDYGKKANRALKLMIKHNMIHFLASDTHKITDGRYDYIELLSKKLKSEIIEELTIINPKYILENKNFKIKKYKECKYTLKKMLNKYKIKK